jgi:L-fuculose-phosphate aldolase
MNPPSPGLLEEGEAEVQARLRDQLGSLGMARGLDLRERIALSCRLLAREGHAGSLAGQVTIRAGQPGSYWTTAWDKGLANAHVGSILRIDEEMNIVEGDGRPNPGVRFHMWIYHARPQARAIVHTHAPHAAALSMLGHALIAAHMDSALFHEDCALLADWPGVPIANEEGRIISEALGGKRSILLANHGLLTVGETLEGAVYLAVLLERACQMQLRAGAVGTIRPLDPDKAREAHDFLLSPRLVAGTMDYWLEQTLRTDPDALR